MLAVQHTMMDRGLRRPEEEAVGAGFGGRAAETSTNSLLSKAGKARDRENAADHRAVRGGKRAFARFKPAARHQRSPQDDGSLPQSGKASGRRS
jgi:hypothetical protein